MSALRIHRSENQETGSRLISRDFITARFHRDLEFPRLRPTAALADPAGGTMSAAAPAVHRRALRSRIVALVKGTLKFVIHRMPGGARSLRLGVRLALRPATRIAARVARQIDRAEMLVTRLDLYLLKPKRST